MNAIEGDIDFILLILYAEILHILTIISHLM